MAEIEYNVPLQDGSFANIVGPKDQVEQMYPNWENDPGRVYNTRYEAITVDDQGRMSSVDMILASGSIGLFNSTLRFKPVGEEAIAIQGNTKTSTCAVAADCGSCVLSTMGLSVQQMAEFNCARANTAKVFESLGQEPEGRFMLLPITATKVMVVSDKSQLTAEYNGNELMQYRLPDASAAVFTESWLYAQGLNDAAFAMNGADGSMGILRADIKDERILIPFCSMKPNMGDRGPEAHILQKAIDAYLDTLDLNDAERQEVISELKPEIILSASAALANFAYKIGIPEEGSAEDLRLREAYPELVAQADGKITPRIVLQDSKYGFPGALERGSIYRQSDAWLGVQSDPYSPTSCPMNGETCNVDYRAETRYAILKQLEGMGIQSENIIYDDSRALDPSAADNNMASNRREQNNGVAVPKTMRTLNGVQIKVRSTEHQRAFDRAAEIEAVGILLNMPLDYPQPDMSDPMVAIYEMRMGHSAPPRELWDKPAVRKEARELGYHPMVYWLTLSTGAEDYRSEAYQRWIESI